MHLTATTLRLNHTKILSYSAFTPFNDPQIPTTEGFLNGCREMTEAWHHLGAEHS